VDGINMTCDAGMCNGMVTITALEDTDVKASAADSNFSTEEMVSIDSLPQHNGLFKWPMPAGLPNGVTVNSATLNLRCYNGGDALRVRRITADWDSATVTHATEPTYVDAFQETGDVGIGVFEVPVDTAVGDWLGGETNYGVRVSATGSNGSLYRSMEWATEAERPYVEIDFSF
jgi:hypothetical protein